jgi:hypothetical protein
MQLYATSFHGSFNHTADFSDPHGAMHGALCPGGKWDESVVEAVQKNMTFQSVPMLLN